MRGQGLARLGIVAAALLIAGCAEAGSPAKSALRYELGDSAASSESGAMEPGDVAQDAAGADRPPAEMPRRIIYRTWIDLSVGDFDEAAGTIPRLVNEFGGYLSASDESGRPGASRRGTWTARVPVERYEAFVEAVLALGELDRRRSDSQDVTAEFYDLEAHIRNKQVEEERLVAHLKETTGELKDILDVERELSRVRGEIEQFQGRRRLLANLTELTTVTIAIRERTTFTPARAANFGDRVGRRFNASFEQFLRFVQEAALAAISVVPWLPFWAIVGLIGWWLWRKVGPVLGRRQGLPRSGTIGAAANPPPKP